MAEMKGKKKRLSINLSFLNLTDHNGSTKLINAHKSPRNFEEPNGVVGLGILAALDYQNNQDLISINGSRNAVLAISPKSLSNPIPVLGNENLFKKTYGKKHSVEEMESCEEYTCVISHVGENLIKKREYFYADFMGNNEGSPGVSAVNGNSDDFGLSSGVISDSLFSYGGETATFCTAEFLSSCFLCKKMLHGLDIFMYRGEKAFCSIECRHKQISIDEQKENCHTGTRKPIDYSISPCSSALQFIAGVAAA